MVDFQDTYPMQAAAPKPRTHERRVTTEGLYLALFWWVVIIVGATIVGAVFA